MSMSPALSLSPSRKHPHVAGTAGRGAVAELCTLAPWDELAAFRKEVQLKFEEAFSMVQERREGESKLERSYQQIEAKIERFARQTRGLHSRSEVFEGHVTGQAKELDACREAHEALRDKLQRGLLDCTTSINSSMSSLRAEVKEVLEQRHETALEVCHRGDRAIADELLKKMGELNDKLGSNMLSLEEELGADLRKLRLELERQDKYCLEGLADTRAVAEQQACQIEERLRCEFKEASDLRYSEVAGRLSDLEARLSKLSETCSRLDSRITAAEATGDSRFEQQEAASEKMAASIARLRTESEGAMRDALRSCREELRVDMRTMRDELTKDLQGLHENMRSSFTSCRESMQSVQQEGTASAAELKRDFRTLCQDVCGMVEDVQNQVASSRTETQSQFDDAAKLQQEMEARLDKQLSAFHEELHESYRGANDQLVSLSETLNATQHRLSDVSVTASRLQCAVEDVTKDLSRCQSFAESAVAEVRHEAALASERHEAFLKRQFKEAKDDLHRSAAEGNECMSSLKVQTEDLSHRLVRAERSSENQFTELRDHLREQSHDWHKLHSESQSKMEEHLKRIARQNDSGIASALSAVREGTAECQRTIDEASRSQELRFGEMLACEKDASCLALAEAVAEIRREMQAIRDTATDHAVDSAGRTEHLAHEVQKQSGAREGLKHMMDDLEMKLEEKFSSLAAKTRTSLQESRQDMRQHIMKQLEERLRPLSDKLAETAGEVKAAKQSEQAYCDKLQKTCADLAASQDSLARQYSATSQEVSDLRIGMHRWQDSSRPSERELSRDRGALQDDFYSRSDNAGYLNDGLGSSHRHKQESPARFGTIFESGHEPARSSRASSQDRWNFSGTRSKPRATFQDIVGASPICSREASALVRKSRTPSPSTGLGRPSDDGWSFGTRSQEAQKRCEALRAHSSPREVSFGGSASPPRSPISYRTARGSYF